MMAIPDITKWFEIIYQILLRYFEHPLILIIGILASIILVPFLLSRKFVTLEDEKNKNDPFYKTRGNQQISGVSKNSEEFLRKNNRSRKHLRILMYFTRTLAIILLIIAIASPFIISQKKISSDPYIKILVDNSTSFELFDQQAASELESKLKNRIKVEVKSIAQGESSEIGSDILQNLEEASNLLLITDGQATSGVNLGDVAIFAKKINTSISLLDLAPIKKEYSVFIEGPSKTISNSETDFTVHVDKAREIDSYPKVKVLVDGQEIWNDIIDQKKSFTRKFSEGFHKIQAQIQEEDHFLQNNIFYKTIKAVPKPNLFYLTDKSITPLSELLSQVYNIDLSPTLPADLSKYHAIILDNQPASKLNIDFDSYSTFVSDGGGLLVVGGTNSFDRGSYKDSLIEGLLPAYVATAGKQEGEINVVIVIDISGSTGLQYGKAATVDVEKALALSTLENIRFDDKVGVVAFRDVAYLVSPLNYLFQQTDLKDKLSRLQDGGTTCIHEGVVGAVNLLRSSSGSKNIILISDGQQSCSQSSPSAPEDSARLANSQGIKVYTIGVGPDTNEDLMKSIARLANGIYFKATEANKIKILFGDIQREENRQSFGVVILNNDHFITQGLQDSGFSASIFGFNSIVPKTSAQLLLTTDTGDALLSTWRFGLGRVAALGTDNGQTFAGQLLTAQNSKLLIRTTNWIIGDPEKRSKNFITASDTRTGEPSTILVKGEEPQNTNINFYKQEDGLFEGKIIPDKTGFLEVLSAVFASNYPLEYQNIGLSEDILSAVYSSGGELFSPQDIDKIVQFVKAASQRNILSKVYLRWPLLLAALTIFLIEVIIRRIVKNKMEIIK